MRMKSKALAVMAAITVASVGLVGCGEDDDCDEARRDVSVEAAVMALPERPSGGTSGGSRSGSGSAGSKSGGGKSKPSGKNKGSSNAGVAVAAGVGMNHDDCDDDD